VIVLDTHVLAWADSDERKLGRKAKGLINRLWIKGGVAVCAMTFWEIALLQSRGRIRLPVGVSEWRERLLAAGLLELPVDGATAVRSVELGGLPDDPVDRLIIATAVGQGAALMTADEALLRWGHALERHDARV
jgi:PIN domain nuclease of toxin-antitoxin system